jgi:hypothetical protein
VRRIQIYIDEPLDHTLEREAKRLGTSKAALIRRAVASEFPDASAPAPDADGWAALDGFLDTEPVDDIDSVIYGPKR